MHRGFDPAAVAARAGVTPDRVFRHALNGFSARLSPDQLATLTAQPGVASVTADGTASAGGNLLTPTDCVAGQHGVEEATP